MIPVADADARSVVSGEIRASKGFTIVGVPKGGAGVSRRLGRGGAFKLRFRRRSGRGATLHLIRPSGTYYGPVRLRRRGSRAYLRLSGRSGSIGAIRLRGGFAAGRSQAPQRLVLMRGPARATRRGKPVGAGRLGLVKRARAAQGGPPPVAPPQGDAALGADPDADGLTNNFDVDDNGNGVVDAADPATGPSQNQPAWIFTNLKVPLEKSLNVNGAAVSRAQIDTLLEGDLWPTFILNPSALGVSGVTAVNVDCFQLRYCRRGDGTATIFEQPFPTVPAAGSRWVDYDPDSDGLPNLARNARNPGDEGWEIGVRSRVPSAAISPADTIAFRTRSSAGDTVFATTMGAYFVTTPGVHTFDDGFGIRTVSYPPRPGEPGTSGGRNDIQLRSDKVAITFWRPQRAAIAGAESGDYRDMGKLNYLVTAPGGSTRGCRGEDYSNLSPTLRKTNDGYYDLLTDTADDAVPDRSKLLSVTVDLGQCLRRDRVVFPACGSLGIEARTAAGNNAAQSIWVRMPGATCLGPPLPGP